MDEEIVREALAEARRRAKETIDAAILRARECVSKGVAYVEAGETPDKGLDCSGLVTYCIPWVLPKLAARQFDHLRHWVFDGEDISFVDVGDLVFFAEGSDWSVPSHVGIVDDVSPVVAWVIHSSQAKERVTRDEFDLVKNSFRDTYHALGVAKMQPFLTRYFLNEEIRRRLQYAIGLV